MHIPLPQRGPGAVLALEEDGAGLQGLEGVPLHGGDIQHIAAGHHIHRLDQRAAVIVQILLEMPEDAHHRLRRGPVPMDRHHRPRLDRIQHPLRAVLRRIPQVQVHPQTGRGLSPGSEVVKDLRGDDHNAAEVRRKT